MYALTAQRGRSRHDRQRQALDHGPVVTPRASIVVTPPGVASAIAPSRSSQLRGGPPIRTSKLQLTHGVPSVASSMPLRTQTPSAELRSWGDSRFQYDFTLARSRRLQATTNAF